MKRVVLDQDIRPMSEFRAGTASFLRQVHKTKRPLIITQHGKGVAVLVDIGEYEALLQRLELLEDIQKAETQLDRGEGTSHKKAWKQVVDVLP